MIIWPLVEWPTSPKLVFAVADVFSINATWTLFNLLPAEPLDGGQLLRTVLERGRAPRDGLMAWVGLLAAAALSLVAIGAGWPGLLLPLAFCGIYNVERLQRHREETTHTEWDRPDDDARARERY